MTLKVKSVQVMVLELLEGGFTEGQLAKKVGSNQPTINRIKNGAKTNYELGKKIEALHLKFEGEKVA